MRSLAILYCFLFTLALSAQREADNWFFGQGVGLNFGQGGKPWTQTGQLHTLEGCASISDENGNLMFYSDGSTVWNNQHEIMLNGTELYGDASSSQSAIIVPNPKKSNLYYLFTVGSTVDPSGYHYYTIDMNGDSGKGEVVGDPVDLSGTQAKNWSEKITAVESKDCGAFWVISIVDDVFHVYKVDENGVSPNPTLSKVNFASRQSRGYLKVSPDGSKLAVAHQGRAPIFSGLYLYSFDNETGKVSNDGIQLFGPNSTESGLDAPYGVEFSPQSTKLYATTTDMEVSYKLYQYDLESNDIAGSITLIHEQEGFRGALQLGTDQKIYATIPVAYEEGTHYLDVIHYPEEKGLACTFQENYIYFGAGFSTQGLPPFIQSLFYTEDINIVDPNEEVTETSTFLNICFDQPFTLQGPDIQGAVYQWTFESDGAVVDLPLPNPPHLFTINQAANNVEGIYTLKVDTYDDCDTQLIGIAELSFMDPPVVAPETSLQQCDRFDTDPTDGLSVFDLNTSLQELVLGDSTDFTIYFYLNDQEAIADQNNINPLPHLYSNNTPKQTITAKIYARNSQCYNLAKVHLEVFTGEAIASDAITVCDVGDGRGNFNLEEVRNTIKLTTQLPTLDVHFYGLLEDAVNAKNELPDIALLEPTQLYFAAFLDGLCYGSGSFMVDIFSYPEFEPNEQLILCDSVYPITLKAPEMEINEADFDFIWSDGQIGSQIAIEEEQTISVKLTHKQLGCEITKFFEVINATLPVIQEVEINPQANSITILTNEQNEPVFSLDNPEGPYQTDPVFFNVYPGEYEVYVKNAYDCDITTRKVYVFGVPKFFTPNNDGVNDRWEIKGLNPEEFSISDVHVFDRFGKHLHSFAAGQDWDGIYNGELLPSNDYWYRFTITDKTNKTTLYKGHFTLIRR